MTIEDVPLERRHLYSQFCYYCGNIMSKKKDSNRKPSIDHKLPTSRGGTDTPENKVRACVPCNKEKGNMTDEEYWQWRRVRNRMTKKAYLRSIGL